MTNSKTATIIPFPDPRPPWEREPDFLTFRRGAYHFVILRHYANLNLNGYVGVGTSHPLYGKSYWSITTPVHWKKKLDNLDVHGGITFSGYGLSHMSPDHWYFGFDTAHFGDYVPGMDKMLDEIYRKNGEERISNRLLFGDVYRTIEYVQSETENLYTQLRKIEKESKREKYLKRVKRKDGRT